MWSLKFTRYTSEMIYLTNWTPRFFSGLRNPRFNWRRTSSQSFLHPKDDDRKAREREREREREGTSVCVCVWEREREWTSACVYVWGEKERERVRVCVCMCVYVCVCVCVREREGTSACVCVRERGRNRRVPELKKEDCFWVCSGTVTTIISSISYNWRRESEK